MENNKCLPCDQNCKTCETTQNYCTGCNEKAFLYGQEEFKTLWPQVQKKLREEMIRDKHKDSHTEDSTH